jgi:hypothetical protein
MSDVVDAIADLKTIRDRGELWLASRERAGAAS